MSPHASQQFLSMTRVLFFWVEECLTMDRRPSSSHMFLLIVAGVLDTCWSCKAYSAERDMQFILRASYYTAVKAVSRGSGELGQLPIAEEVWGFFSVFKKFYKRALGLFLYGDQHNPVYGVLLFGYYGKEGAISETLLTKGFWAKSGRRCKRS